MPTVRIEHKVHDYDVWKAAFDSDPAGRQKSGVCRYRVSRLVDDPTYVMIDLDFDSIGEAESFLEVMRGVWKSPQATSAVLGSPRAQIVEVIESKEY